MIWTGAGDGIAVAADSQSGFTSDFNLFYTSGAGTVGSWQGADRASLLSWQTATFGDKNSLFGDPLFVDADGADGILGFQSAAADGRDDDFHVRSQYGSFHGGALAPVAGGAGTGLPVFLGATLTLDGATSPGIDRGAPTDPFANEPANNGGYVNIGAYGNTVQASKSPSTYVLVTNPNGNEAVPQESSFDVRWRSTGFAGNVNLDWSDDGGATWNVLSTDEANDGVFTWTVDPATFPIDNDYRIRVRSAATPSIFDVSDNLFAVTAPISIYYVNDGFHGR